MTNAEVASSLPIPLLLLRLCDGKRLKRDIFTAEVTNILFAYTVLPASFISVLGDGHEHLAHTLMAVLALTHLLLKSPCDSLLALLLWCATRVTWRGIWEPSASQMGWPLTCPLGTSWLFREWRLRSPPVCCISMKTTTSTGQPFILHLFKRH